MKIGTNVIEFEAYAELTQFCEDFQMFGRLEFDRAVRDNNGHTLIEKHVPVRASQMTRLKELEGSYLQRFRVRITGELLARLRSHLAGRMFHRLPENTAGFTRVLRDAGSYNYRDLVESALRSRTLILVLYRASVLDPQFFAHVTGLGLLCLFIAVGVKPPVQYLRRHAFLAGLGADLALADSGAWRFPVIGGEQKRRVARTCAEFAKVFDLPEECLEAVAAHPADLEYERSDASEAAADESLPAQFAGAAFDALLDETEEEGAALPSLLDADEEDEAESNPPGEDEAEDAEAKSQQKEEPPEDGIAVPPYDGERSRRITDILRIARYVDDISRRRHNREQFAEDCVYYIAYYSGKGVFDRSIAHSIIATFHEYQREAARVEAIARVENECLHPPSAWAYPRPLDAAQMICRNKITECPLFISSWGIHVVQAMPAFGWLGAELPPGEYPKCKLGDKLK